jgi:hypothetical protein
MMDDKSDSNDHLEFGSSEGARPVVTGKVDDRRLLHLNYAVLIVLRAVLAFTLAALFVGINYQAWLLIPRAFESDVELIRAGKITADQRIVTERVLIALIGFTAAEVAVGIAALVRYSFTGNGKVSRTAPPRVPVPVTRKAPTDNKRPPRRTLLGGKEPGKGEPTE